MERFKKIFAAGVIFVTVLSMSVVVAPEAGAVAVAGDLIKMSGLSSVYYLAADGKRYVFPNEQTYFSWYSDFSGVVTIPQSELEALPLGANVTVRPGTKLVKITTNPKVYAVTANGNLLAIPDEATAATLYGSMWNKRIIDVPDAFFTNYKISVSIVSATAYPQGSLVKFGASPDVFYINADGTASKIANEAALAANRFKLTDIITATIAKPTEGVAITGAVAALIDVSSGAGGVAGAGTGLTAALAADTPASATVITDTTAVTGNGQANVSFVKVNFTAAADGDVKVKNLKFKRTGISADTDLDNLYLYDGATRLTDGSSISSNFVTFNNASGLFTVAKGTTKSITLVGDMNFAATSGKTIGFGVVAATDVVTDGAAVSGTFPASGNLMSTANATDLGKLTFTSGSFNIPTGVDTSITPANDQEVWRFTLQSTSQELKVERLKMTAVGSIQLTDLKNLKLSISGAQVGPIVAAMTTGNVVDFDLTAAPLVVPKGSSKTVSVRADITNGSTRTFYMSFQNQQDIIVKDASYNVYIEPYQAGTFTVIKPGSSANWLIAAGDLAVSRASNSPTNDVAVDATNQTLAIFDFTASGEDIKVQNLDIQANIVGGANGGILNGKVVVTGAKDTAADTQLGTTKNLTEATDVNFTFGSTFIVKAGTTAKVKIVGDVKTTTSTSYAGGETVAITIGTGSSNVQRMTSLGTLNRPATDTTAFILNITSAALTATKFSGFGNQTVAAGTNDAKLSSFVIGAGAAEGVTVNSITIALTAANANSSTITRMYIKDHATGAALGDIKTSISTSNIYTVSFNLAASNGKVIDLYGDIKSGANVGSWIANVSADGVGLNTSKAVTGGSATNAMQTITVGSGSLTATNGAKPTAAILIGGSTGNNLAQFTFSAANEGFTIDKLKLKVPNNFATSTTGITIKYRDKAGATQQSTQVLAFAAADVSATATYAGLTLYVPANGSANLDVYVDLTSVGTGAGASGASGAITFDWNEGFNATGDSGTSVTTVGSADLTNNTFYVRKSKPTFALLDAGTAPTTRLFKFSVVADNAGNIDIKQLAFNFVTSSATITSVKLFDSQGTALTTTGLTPTWNGTSANVSLLDSAIDDTVETIGPVAVTYEVRGTVSSFVKNTSTITVSFAADTTAGATVGAFTAGADGTYTANEGNIWSDRSASAHTTATADWTNGFLLKDMTTSQSF
ncbi:MAG: hypothetical protein HYV53_01105 [Parcubacteria group bacterium]|nr:hypothetical protein [Parcubacteria group bacterium]